VGEDALWLFCLMVLALSVPAWIYAWAMYDPYPHRHVRLWLWLTGWLP
jgi:hypothetical protein